MTLIENREQLLSNIQKVEYYLTEGNTIEQQEIHSLIRKGKNLLAYQVGQEVRFAPSRFLGYVNNTIEKHNAAKKKKDVDGRETTPVISDILEHRLSVSTALENRYVSYCSNLGLIPADFRRTYWNIALEADFTENSLLFGEFPEGKIVERIHKARERNFKVVELAKANFRKKHGKLFCQVCGFDFKEQYGELGNDFIEGHHTVAVSQMKEGHVTKPEEIALLCANCHRMVHKKRPWLTIEKLNSLLKNNKK